MVCASVLGFCRGICATPEITVMGDSNGDRAMTAPSPYFYTFSIGPTINATDFAICPSRSDGIYIAYSNEQSSIMKWIQILDDGSAAGIGQFRNLYFDGSYYNTEYFELGSLVTLDSTDTLVLGGSLVFSQGGPPHAIGPRSWHIRSSLVSGLPNASIDWQVDRPLDVPTGYTFVDHRLAMLGTGGLISLINGEGGLVLAKFDVNGNLEASNLYTIENQTLLGRGLHIGSGDRILIAGKIGFNLLIASISSPDQHLACSVNLSAIEPLTGAAIAECADGSLIVAARPDSGRGTILMRLDPQLQQIHWIRKIWGVTPPENGIPFLDDSHFVLCGADQAMVVMKWSISGELEWSYQVSGGSPIARVTSCRTTAGRIAVVGITPGTSLSILQTDPAGQYPECPAVSPYLPQITTLFGVVSTNVMSSEIFEPLCQGGAWLRWGSMTVNPTVVCAPETATPTPTPSPEPPSFYYSLSVLNETQQPKAVTSLFLEPDLDAGFHIGIASSTGFDFLNICGNGWVANQRFMFFDHDFDLTGFHVGSMIALDDNTRIVNGSFTQQDIPSGPPHFFLDENRDTSYQASYTSVIRPSGSIAWSRVRNITLSGNHPAARACLVETQPNHFASITNYRINAKASIVIDSFDLNSASDTGAYFSATDTSLMIATSATTNQDGDAVITGVCGSNALLMIYSNPDDYFVTSVDGGLSLQGNSITVGPDGSYYILARQFSSPSATQLIKVNSALDQVEWIRKIDALKPGTDCIRFIDDTHFLICCHDSDLYVMRWDINGNLDWAYRMETDSVTELSEVVSAKTRTNDYVFAAHAGSTSVYLLKTDETGRFDSCNTVSSFDPIITAISGTLESPSLYRGTVGSNLPESGGMLLHTYAITPICGIIPDQSPTPSLPTRTPTLPPTWTPWPPTYTPQPTSTPTGSMTPSPTETPDPSYTPTQLPSFTPTQAPSFTSTPPIPSNTPTPTGPSPITPPAQPSPTQTPNDDDCETPGTTLWMPASVIAPGDTVECRVTVCVTENEPMTGYPLFVLLEFNGLFYFAPSFDSFDHYLSLYPAFLPGETDIEIVPAFIWPDTGGSTGSATWHSALTTPDMTAIFGQMDSFPFTWTD